jgi:hypothetical protein
VLHLSSPAFCLSVRQFNGPLNSTVLQRKRVQASFRKAAIRREDQFYRYAPRKEQA